MNLDHLKYCVDKTHTHSGYACARCNRFYCSRCDHALLPEISERYGIKTLVRYCPDWRCQRERQIEEGELDVVPRDD